MRYYKTVYVENDLDSVGVDHQLEVLKKTIPSLDFDVNWDRVKDDDEDNDKILVMDEVYLDGNSGKIGLVVGITPDRVRIKWQDRQKDWYDIGRVHKKI